MLGRAATAAAASLHGGACGLPRSPGRHLTSVGSLVGGPLGGLLRDITGWTQG